MCVALRPHNNVTIIPITKLSNSSLQESPYIQATIVFPISFLDQYFTIIDVYILYIDWESRR